MPVTRKTHFSILFITDNQLSREKTHILNRTLYELKQEFSVEVIRGETDPTESQILEQISQLESEKTPIHLILAPLHWYASWHRIEGFWGANRTSGSTFAGYFCEAVLFTKLPAFQNQARKIILDFCRLTTYEQVLLVRALVSDQLRSGILPLLPPKTPIYCESWYTNQGLGNRFDQVLNLPEIAKTEWIKRASALHILLSALWGLVYVGRLGKSDWVPTREGAPPKAYLQIGIDPSCLVFRLCFTALPRLFAQNCVQLFSPNPDTPTHPSQLLVQFSDFLRVHPLGDSSDVEVVVGLFPSAPSEKAHRELHTLWLEPLSDHLVSERPNQAPTPEAPYLRNLPTVSRVAPNLTLIETKTIAHLKDKVKEREDQIKELKEGGVGNSAPLEPPDAEALLEGFQERYFDAKHQIRRFEIEIMQIEKAGGTAQEVHTLRLKMDALRNREAAWIRRLMATIENFKENFKENSKKEKKDKKEN